MPGSGKSTWTAKFLDGFEGPVLLISQEEGLGETVAGRMRRLEICREDFHLAVVSTLDEIAELVAEIHPASIAIDSVSVTTLTTGDLQRLTAWAKVPLVAVLHETKAGAASGAMSLLHAADTVLRTEAMRWKLEKSRSCPLVEGEV
jgi:predicted ATP-dependent serine protease